MLAYDLKQTTIRYMYIQYTVYETRYGACGVSTSISISDCDSYVLSGDDDTE